MNFRLYFLPLVIVFFLSSCSSSSSEPLILSEQQEKNILNEYKGLLEKKKYEKAYKKLDFFHKSFFTQLQVINSSN